MRMLVLTLLTFKKVKLIFGHPVHSLTVSLIFSNNIDTKLKHILLFQKIQHGARDGVRMGCVPRRENPLYVNTCKESLHDAVLTYANDFAPPLGFLYVLRDMQTNNKTCCYF